VEAVSNEDIARVDVNAIPDHEMLVGGFPCQDYSVANSLGNARGLDGKKGQLWWSIESILRCHRTPAKYLFLENVDRIINSPAKQRGRDFAIILATLASLNYIVEWRVINGADYGKVQRRRRTYIIAYKGNTAIHGYISSMRDPLQWILEEGTMASTYNIVPDGRSSPITFSISSDLKEISDNFGKGLSTSLFENAGIMVNRVVYTVRTKPRYSGGYQLLRDVLMPESEVPKEYYVQEKDLPKWRYLKGSKKIARQRADGSVYTYSEGAMAFPDPLNRPSRTIITGEGGASPSRFKHVVEVVPGRYRRLTPVELERLNGFPDNHTEGATAARRAFLMGNALIVGIVEDLGRSLVRKIAECDGVR
jgi:DNA (cytosine-5-)-methyltransferase